ncbi:anti-virulence regulator CigR family protein [Vogesella sp. LIG4]|uniref:anti-virulence regulator CigR family protein n=1 Tax=Vogesella sp. LIG4 TaxID=1192162 RepID=UPI00081FBBDA|nr:anti-virulence regulator CigR family protein [Vogesella sp. LIG4]SCK11995.1 hypothetical protein PSELUDRAFT_1047 [Vogesella sp. LIG4]
MKRHWPQSLLLVSLGLALVCPPVFATPEWKGNGDNRSQDQSYGNQGEIPPWQQGKKHDKEWKRDKHDKHEHDSKYERRDERGRRYESAGLSDRDARRFAYESHLNYGEYRSLPPGIRKNMERGKPLPPGIAKRYVPHDMLVRLPVHPGYEWRVVGTDLVLVTVGTLIVQEVLMDIFMNH